MINDQTSHNHSETLAIRREAAGLVWFELPDRARPIPHRLGRCRPGCVVGAAARRGGDPMTAQPTINSIFAMPRSSPCTSSSSAAASVA